MSNMSLRFEEGEYRGIALTKYADSLGLSLLDLKSMNNNAVIVRGGTTILNGVLTGLDINSAFEKVILICSMRTLLHSLHCFLLPESAFMHNQSPTFCLTLQMSFSYEHS